MDSIDSESDALDPAVYDHLQPVEDSGAPVQPGVYRVVGTGESVTLLQVGDADGRRVHTGHVVSVDRDDLAAFERADNPDGSRPITGMFDDLGWQLRAFARGLRARPLVSLVAGVGFLAGTVAENRLPGPEFVATALVFGGAIVLAYVGSRNG